MRLRYAALYIALGMALGLCLHLAGVTQDAQAGRIAPSSPYVHVGPVYA